MRLFILIITILALLSCGGEQPPTELSPIELTAKQPVNYVALSQNVMQSTPNGTLVFSVSGLPATHLRLVDDGIDELYREAFEDGFKITAFIPYNRIEIYIPPYSCTPSPEGKVPSFLLNAGKQYDGSQYDQYNPKGKGVKDGISVIYAAEKVLNFGGQGTNAKIYVCPDTMVLKDAVKHGLEHVFLQRFPYAELYRHKPPYDGTQYFNCSLNHVIGINHPLLPRNGRCEVY